MLQGISKLDYLVKVSIFQKYKDSDLNDHRDPLGPVTTFIGDTSEHSLSTKINGLSYK